MNTAKPIVWNDAHAAWLVRSYAEIVAILQDDRFVASSGRAPSDPEASPVPDPNLGALRQHVIKALHRCGPWLREMMRTEAESLRTKLGEPASLDLAGDLIQPWSAGLAARCTDAKLEDSQRSELDHAAQAVFLMSGSPTPESPRLEASGHEGTALLASFFLRQLQKAAEDASCDSVLGTLTNGPHSPAELVATCVQLFVGVSTSLPLLLGNAVYRLHTTPELAAEILDLEPRTKQARTAINELLRIAGPAKIVYRIATSAITVGEHTFHQGDRLALALDEANREISPLANPTPSGCPHKPTTNPHLSLGMGHHACLGSPLIQEACSFLPCWILQAFPPGTWCLDTKRARLGGHQTISGYTFLPISQRGQP